jgi:glutamyl-tRNA reductase
VPAIPVAHAVPVPEDPGPQPSTTGRGSMTTPLMLAGLEFSLDTASLDALETVTRAVTKAQVAEWFDRYRGTEEVALLSTCHRVEILLLVRSLDEVDRWRDVLPGRRGSWRSRDGREAVHHLFRVAAGRESLAVGEGEVRHQVRAAERSILSRHPRPVLRDLFVGAVGTAEEVRPSVPLSCSIASIAASRLLDLVGRSDPHVLVVGSGTVGRQVAECLAPFARVTLVFHQRSPDETFLRATGARAVPLDRLGEALAGSDAVVTAAKFGNHGLHASELPRDRPLVLVDLGVPRNVDPGVQELPNVRLIDLAELHARTGGSPSMHADDRRVEELAEKHSDRLERLLLEPWIGDYRRAAEAVRRSELDRARPFLGALDPAQWIAVERLTQRLVARLLSSPTERIRSLPPGPDGDALRRLAIELLRLPSADP